MLINKLQKNRQQGFVLVMALVMLTVLTLIGMASMNSASIEQKASANAKQHLVAFNLVQSVIEYLVSEDASAVVDYQPSDLSVVQNISYAIAGSNTAAVVTHSGCASDVGSSLEAGKGFSYNFFNIAASGSNSTVTATSVQGQGVRYPSASCGSL